MAKRAHSKPHAAKPKIDFDTTRDHLLRLLGLPHRASRGNFELAFQPSIEHSCIEALGTCAWIREPYVLLI